jgi:hypothetical protein
VEIVMRMISLIAAAGLLTLVSSASLAQETALTVTDGTRTVTLDMAEIEALPQQAFETSTVWTEGVQVFSGPSMQSVLQEAGFSGVTVLAEALDGYSVEIPRDRLTGDGGILAVRMDGAPLPEKKAPYWIVFPYDQSPEINDKDHQDWSVWAVTKLTVK